MGNQCLASTPNQKYNSYLSQVDVAQLKDLWQKSKVQKIRSIFQNSATYFQQQNSSVLTFQSFSKIFPALYSYNATQIQRLYQIFDYQNKGCVDWNNFYSAITLCYFAPQHILAVVMFMMYDATLQKTMDNLCLKNMVSANQQYLIQKPGQGGMYQVEQVVKFFSRKQGQPLRVEQWVSRADDYMDFSKFRTVFNIFLDQQMEKQLAKTFSKENQLYSVEHQRYVGYLICGKWFQTWKMYIQHTYNIDISVSQRAAPNKIKTAKSLRRTNSKAQARVNKIDTFKDLHGCRGFKIARTNPHNTHKDVDCVHSHLGQRPRAINNLFLQGQYQQVLKTGLCQNMDYVIVSQKVWQSFRDIYDGGPQFKRTGFDGIELYPKMVHIYLSLFKQQIDYSAEIPRAVSPTVSVKELMEKACQLTSQQLNEKRIFFKAKGLDMWQQIQDLTYVLDQLTPQINLYIICLGKKQAQIFWKTHQKPPKSVTQVSVGDYLHYTTKDTDTQVVFMGKDIQGKYILHVQGTHYWKDYCLLQQQVIKYCEMGDAKKRTSLLKSKNQPLIGLPNRPDFAFFSCILMQLIYSKPIRDRCSQISNIDENYFMSQLCQINNMITTNSSVQAQSIKQIVNMYFPNFSSFDISMAPILLQQIMKQIKQQLEKAKLPSVTDKYAIKIDRKVQCKQCKNKSSKTQDLFVLRLPLPLQQYDKFTVVWVPQLQKGEAICKFRLQIPQNCTLAQFMTIFQAVAGIKGQHYLLAEVYGHDIVKNYHSSNRQVTLKQLKMRPQDQLYAYQLTTNVNSFVSEHFGGGPQISYNQIKKDMFIDCKSQQKGWTMGKVVQTQRFSKGQFSYLAFVKVIHKFNKNQTWQCTYGLDQDTVARFPTKCHKNGQHYHLRVQQRIFNEVTNSMDLVSMPLVVLLPSWMRWKQFSLFVYFHMRRFIAQKYNFVDQPVKNTKKKSMDAFITQKTQQFKNYKNSQKFPYTLRLCDYQGKCLICSKLLKSTVFNGEGRNYCSGCSLSQSDPILWQVKAADLMVCVDWRGNDRFKTDLIVQKSAPALAQSHSSADLSSCLSLIKSPYLLKQQRICCNTLSQKVLLDKLSLISNQLIIFLERFVQEQDGFKQLLTQHIKFPLKGLDVNGGKYSLVGLVSIQGAGVNIRHKTYVSQGEWREYEGRCGRVVEEGVVEKQCAFVLFYQTA